MTRGKNTEASLGPRPTQTKLHACRSLTTNTIHKCSGTVCEPDAEQTPLQPLASAFTCVALRPQTTPLQHPTALCHFAGTPSPCRTEQRSLWSAVTCRPSRCRRRQVLPFNAPNTLECCPRNTPLSRVAARSRLRPPPPRRSRCCHKLSRTWSRMPAPRTPSRFPTWLGASSQR